MFVSITRLRLRSIRFLPAFLLDTWRSVHQIKRAEGFLGGAMLADRRQTYWTMTLWRDQADMRRYMTGGAHLKAMPKLMEWCDEGSVTHWTQDEARLPDWTEADRRMRAEGRPSKVRRPAPGHAELAYASPRVTSAVPLTPVAGVTPPR